MNAAATAPGGGLRVRQLVLQPTPFCNIDCRYCYLSARTDRHRMAPGTVRAACRCVFGSPYAGRTLEVIWHAGEPLVLPPSYYEEAFAIVAEETPPRCRVVHAMQTNGLLIDDAWSAFFRAHEVRLGLSIDGPAWLHDRNRTTRAGRGTHAQVMAAAEILRRNGVEYEAIAVLTRDSLEHPDEIYHFFEGLGVRRVGFNVEESEGNHRSATLASDDLVAAYAAFMDRLTDLQERGTVRVRELDAIRRALLGSIGDVRSTEATPLDIVSVDSRGNLATFSPELLGLELPGLGAFRFGNVATTSLDDMLADRRFAAVAADVARGVEACRDECGYFALCGGGAPANKFFENGSFASAATRHCATRVKANAEVLLGRLEAPAADPGSYRHAGATIIP